VNRNTHAQKAVINSRIRAQRKASRIKGLREAHAAGHDVDGMCALVRVSAATTRILVGIDNVETWDLEELQQGRRRDKDGMFRGRKPEIVPKVIIAELQVRMDSHVQQRINKLKERAVDQLVMMLEGSETDDRERLKAIEMIFDRASTVVGPAAATAGEQAGPMPRWQMAIDAGIVAAPEELNAPIEATSRETKRKPRKPRKTA
jgi:hypothetical protein